MSSRPRKEKRQADGRPDPEELLKRYHLQDHEVEAPSSTSGYGKDTTKPRSGRLRVYLGSSAGVGKTYAMLNEGNRRKERGTDVVIGFVETHGRSQTKAQIGNLEILPRKKIPYRGVTLEEMDTDAIIVRHPQVVLVDELAHTNVAGSHHPKRYQDVQDILNAGIDVITTLNVQHLESLNDLVEDVTGVRVRETLPDRILDQADEVELIDIAPNALRQRMKHGNIYSADRIETALENFFTEANLTALRELALRQTASKTAAQLQQYMTGSEARTLRSATERVLVGFDARPKSRAVIRDAWRLAHGMNADLIAITIELTGYPGFIRKVFAFFKYGRKLDIFLAERERMINEYAVLAEDLGAEVLRLKSNDIATAIARVAEERQITQIVLGQPEHSRLEILFYGSVTNRILRLTSGIDIHLVPLRRKNMPVV